MITEHSGATDITSNPVEKTREQLQTEMQVMEQKLVMMNARLIESEQSKSVFLAKVRNEINNPLTTLLFFAQELSQYESDDPKQVRQMGSTIYRDMFILNLQLQNIIVSSELESGVLELSPRNVNVRNLMQECISGMEILSRGSKKLNVTLQIDQELCDTPFFVTDPDKLKSILDNMIANAIEYTPKKGTITVESWRSAEQLFIKVRDQGSGIFSGDQNRLFDRFRQVNKLPSGSHKGHGLGLSLIKGVTEFLGGVVLVDTVMGKGTTFTVNIPEYISEYDKEHQRLKNGTNFTDDELSDDMELF